jgi:hypothetical protein
MSLAAYAGRLLYFEGVTIQPKPEIDFITGDWLLEIRD